MLYRVRSFFSILKVQRAMKTINFKKYNATGNDFIIIDNRESVVDASDKTLWAKLCKNRTGISADGVLLVEKSSKADFKMRYINADGGEVSMCGNGARAITAFCHEELKLNKKTYHFETANSIYECTPDESYGYRLKMTELYDIGKYEIDDLFKESLGAQFLNTGVPHCVFECKKVKDLDVYQLGKNIRYQSRFENGTNVNFYEVIGPAKLKMRTYERGVENETLACGTGAVATALVAAKKHQFKNEIELETEGGLLAVKFSDDFKEIYLCGKVEKVFDGSFQIH
jgi:diaminopimelate epimerase